MVSVLVAASKVGRFRHGPSCGLLRAIEVRSTAYFGGEVKPVALCRKILRHSKSYASITQTKILRKSICIIPFALSPGCYHMNAGVIATDLWWTNQGFSSVDILPPCSPCLYIT
jgi:hypothetical protein